MAPLSRPGRHLDTAHDAINIRNVITDCPKLREGLTLSFSRVAIYTTAEEPFEFMVSRVNNTHLKAARAHRSLHSECWTIEMRCLQNLATNAWTGSVLVVSYGNQPPSLSLSHSGHQFTPQPVCLDTFQNYCFWRWQLDLQLMPQESVVDYWVSTEWARGQTYQKSFRFSLPGSSQSWHWGFHSCNGFSHGIDPPAAPNHVSGNYQVYCLFNA